MTDTDVVLEHAPPLDRTRRPSARERLRSWDPLVAAVSVVSLVVYALHGFDGILTRDLGVYSYGGQQVAEGVPPYVAILNRAGPLGHLVPGIAAFAARIVGMDDLLAMRLLLMLVTVACVAATYVLVRDVFSSRVAGLAGAAAILSLQGVVTYATYGPREKTLMLLFVTAAMIAIDRQRWATSGFFIALATLTWQPAFAAAAAAAVIAALLGERTARARITALVRIVVGGAVPTLATVACYAALGQVQVFLDDFLLINLRYTQQISLLSEPDRLLRVLEGGFGWSLWVFVVGFVLLLPVTAAALVRPGRRDRHTVTLVAATVMLAVGVWWSWKAYNGWPDVFFVLPAAFLGIGGAVHALVRKVPGPVPVAAALAGVMALVVVTVDFSVTERDHDLVQQRADTATVLRDLPPGSRIASVSAPGALVLAHMRNVSRLQLFGNGLADYVDDTWPGGMTGYARWFVRQKPDVIAVGTSEALADLFLAEMGRDYTCVGASPAWLWYVRSDVGRPTIQRLRADLTGGCGGRRSSS